MANKDSCLAYLDITKSIVSLSRNQILGSYHRCKHLKFDPCYIDTDSLMVPEWPWNHCDTMNEWLNLPKVELKYEQRMKRLLVLYKKRYIYETEKGQIVTKGFQKRINPTVEFMPDVILKAVWQAIFLPDEAEQTVSLTSQGWIVLVDTLLQVMYMCRDPKKNSIYRKTKNLENYKSKSCTAMRILTKYPDKANDYVDYTYSRSDGAASEATKCVLDVEECEWVNYEQLFMSQKKIYCILLNTAFWKLPDPIKWFDLILNALHWKSFVHAELKYYYKTRKRFVLLVAQKVRYTFKINDHFKRKRGTLVLDNEETVKKVKNF
ncbi:hypothetical protein AVEN_166606-1 [Araneus ventricosus]|uniref:Uncharacterized protein n=1 Tax=Araneus ventricosus TaxID=182803 RepID=A0A4Y2WGX6_ARAVE|nr:hypothetical protein AVEN_166606-1 [Araneus ventricosus]